MRISALVTVAALLLSTAAQAETPVQIHVFSTGVATAGMRVVGLRFKEANPGWESGPDVSVTLGTAQKTENDATAPGSNADIVILPNDVMDRLEKSGVVLQGSNKRLGRVDLGVAVATGQPHPDISTYAKFRDALLKAGTVAYTDPKGGSAGGIMISHFLARPEFAGLKIVLSGMGSQSAAKGDAPIAIETMGTLLGTYGADFVGLVPASLNAHLYFSIGVMANAPAQKDALALEKYALRPESKAVWKEWGVVR